MGSVGILVVEDDADIRSALGDILADEGYAVSSAADGREALELLRAGLSPRVILLDLMMPVMTGPAFRAAQLAEPSLSGIPVILITAGGRLREVSQALGAEASFSKPFELSRLLRAIAGVVAHQRSAAA
ncbi:MAG TPA: response regulator [Anaeromyxobacteraceae bacterium]